MEQKRKPIIIFRLTVTTGFTYTMDQDVIPSFFLQFVAVFNLLVCNVLNSLNYPNLISKTLPLNQSLASQ